MITAAAGTAIGKFIAKDDDVDVVVVAVILDLRANPSNDPETKDSFYIAITFTYLFSYLFL